MRNLRQLRAAVVFAMSVGAGMIIAGPTLHAQVPGSPKSVSTRCDLLAKAIASVGADSSLGQYLQGIYAANCQ